MRTDVRSLLPADEGARTATSLLSSISEHNARRLIVTVGADSEDSALSAAEIVRTRLRAENLTVESADPDMLKRTLTVLRPHREVFLTDEDRAFLHDASDVQLVRRALKRLYRPLNTDLVPWQDDPLGLFSDRLQALFTTSRFNVQGEFLTVGSRSDPSRFAVVLNVTADRSLQLSDTPLTHAVAAARDAARARFPHARIAAAGPQLMAEAASAQARRESTLIGAFSALAIALMVVTAFGALRPAGWMVGVLGISAAAAFSVVWLVFGEIHLLTLVFGATLLGIAADYVFHFLMELFEAPTPRQARRRLLVPMGISLLTSLAGYSVMLWIPLPVLRQTGLFCMTGLVVAFACVMLWGPVLAAHRPMPRLTRRLGTRLQSLLRLSPKGTVALVLGLPLLLSPGLMHLEKGRELQLLNSLPAEILAQQQAVAAQTGLPSPGQFFLVQGENTDDALTRLETLKTRLKRAVDEHVVLGYQSAEGPLIPVRLQENTRPLVHDVNRKVRQAVADRLGTAPAAADPVSDAPFTLEQWLESPAGSAFRPFWPDEATTVVLLSGVTPASLPALQRLTENLPGVRFINTTGTIQAQLTHWCRLTVRVLVFALILSTLLLALLYRQTAWRLVLPTLLALVSTMSLLGWIGIPVSLFSILPSILLLALGADYAVLLYSNPKGLSTHLSVALAALSTLLSFGLLAFSATPALHHFGLTLLLGLAFVWFFTLLLRPGAALNSRWNGNTPVH